METEKKISDFDIPVGMKRKPYSGIYGDDLVYKIYTQLFEALEEFIPNHVVGAHLNGTCSDMRAKAAHIKNLASSLVSATKAVQSTRK